MIAFLNSLFRGTRAHFTKHSVAFRLLFYILVLSSLITVVITVLQLYFDYREEVKLVDTRMIQIDESYRDSLSNAMWYLQTEQVEKILSGIVMFDDIHYAEVNITGDKTYVHGTQRESNIKQYRSDIILNMDNQTIYAGSLSIHSNFDGIIHRLSKKFYIILLSQAVKTFVISIFILFVVYYLITRHLQQIARFTNQISMQNTNPTLFFGPSKTNKHPDELDNIASALNQMMNTLENDRLRILANFSYDIIWEWDINTGVHNWYGDIDTALGYLKNELPRTVDGWKQVIHPDDLSRVEDTLTKHHNERIEWHEIYRVIRKDGSIRYWDDRGETRWDKDGLPLVMTGAITDITDQKEMEIKLQDNSERFERWKESNFVGVLQSNNAGDITEANNALLSMLGYTRQDLHDGLLDWTLLTPPELLHLDQKAIDEAAIKGFWTPFEKQYFHKDGHRVPIMLGGSMFKQDPGEYIAFVIDLSASKDTEARLEMALQATESGTWDWNIRTGEVVLDRNWLAMTGYSTEDLEPHISSWRNLIHPEDVDALNEALDIHFQGKSSYYEFEYRMRTKNGSYIWSYDRGKVIERDENNSPLRMIGIDSNITQRRQLDEQIRRTQKMEALGKLTGGIAHDFNNMLGIVEGYSQLLKDALTGQPKLANYAHEINHASERGAKLTNKLLGFSRVQSSDPESLDLNSLLREEQDMLSKALTVRIELNLDLANDLWPVWLDAADLEDAILNLSINAMHATPIRGRLNICSHNQHLTTDEAKALSLPGRDYVVLSFQDNGVGMDNEVINQIFEPFFSTKGELGTGLGLSQVYGFVKRSLGAIKVSSELGFGSCFELYFPRHIEEDKPAIVEVDQAIEIKGSERILVVDDEPAILTLTCEILQLEGYQVKSARHGKEALELLKITPIDLLISDILMPEMDGYTLATTVKVLYPSVQIQLVSGYAGDSDTDEVEDHLRSNLLYKPVPAKDLLVRVRSLLDLRIQTDTSNRPGQTL